MTTFDCKNCNKTVSITHKGNFFSCSYCGSTHFLEQEGKAVLVVQANKNEYKRLREEIKNYFITYNNEQVRFSGLLAFDFCESVLYLFFSEHYPTSIFIFYNYNWYQGLWEEKPEFKTKSYKSEVGTTLKLFENKDCLIIGSNEKVSFMAAGNFYFPLTEFKEIELVEYLYNNEHRFAFFQSDGNKLDLFLSEIEAEADYDIFHSTINYDCTYCGKTNAVPQFPMVRSFTCNHCRTAHFTDLSGLVKVSENEYSYEKSFGVEIKPGNIATIEGVNYELIGVTRRIEGNADYWGEYTLWNPVKGFMYLSEYEGNWVLLEPLNYIRQDIYKAGVGRSQPYSIYSGEQEFKIYSRFKSRIFLCLGHFAGNIFNEKFVQSLEYLAPPEAITLEQPYGERIMAFHGKSVTQKQLRLFFKEPLKLSYRESFGAVQAIPGGIHYKKLYVYIVGMFLLMLLVTVTTNTLKRHKREYEFNHQTPPTFISQPQIINNRIAISTMDTSNNREWLKILESKYNSNFYDTSISGIPYLLLRMDKRVNSAWGSGLPDINENAVFIEFDEKSNNNLRVDFNTNLSNSWQDLQIDVVNLKEGTTYSKLISNEHYSGYDEGSSWTEDNNNNYTVFYNLPKGKYQLIYTSYFPENIVNSKWYQVIITSDVALWSNFGYALLIGLLPLLLYTFYIHWLDDSRWQESRFHKRK